MDGADAALGPRRARGDLPRAARHDPRPRDARTPRLHPLLGGGGGGGWVSRGKTGDRLPPRVPRRGSGGAGAVPRGGAGRRDPARRAGHGTRRRGRDHGRRDAPGELLEPLRHRSRRRRPRQPRRRARPHRPREPGAARHRRDPPHAAGRGARRRVPALAHRPAHQDHRPRAVHDDATGAERPLPGRAEPRARLRGGRQRGAPRPEGRRRGRRPDRRAVPPGAARGGPGYAVEAIDRALEGIEGETVLHTCFGYAHIVHDRLTGYPFLAELNECTATHISIEAAQPDLDPDVLRGCRTRRSSSASSISGRRRRRRPRR